jgi:KDO2-lipid IV(A) lauroyltransferase
MPVAIQHNVTDHQYAGMLKGWNLYLHGCLFRRRQTAAIIAQAFPPGLVAASANRYNPGIRMNANPYAIRYWPTWLALGLLRCLVWLPYRTQLAAGRLLGGAFRLLAHQRRRIAAINIALCFPELGATAQQQLLHEHFTALGIGLVETAMSWWESTARLQRLVRVNGLEHLQQALAGGKGVILLSAHFTTLEIGGRLLALSTPFHVLYREHKNPVIEQVMRNARIRNYDRAIPRHDLRAMLRSLQDNMPVWYAPDQDHGVSQGLFVPFFGIPAATITATSRLARTSGAAVVPFIPTRLPDGKGYRLMLYPALEHFPGTSLATDTERINALLEARIREQPAQYLWVHRRFKTRPPGEAGVY